MQIVRLLGLSALAILVMFGPTSAETQGKTHVTSEQVTRAIQELEKLAQKQVQENAVPGLAIAVVFQDKAVCAKGFGVRDTNTKQPIDADTVFQFASISKSVGSTIVAELVGEGIKSSWKISTCGAKEPSNVPPIEGSALKGSG
jgi:CubicO group peptidase (beta-lactamase class C family)